ncbi:MAG: ABC transporter permease [Bacteroidales bacterium]|nr:ABC transporter permease [Bacteroidales bacterium]
MTDLIKIELYKIFTRKRTYIGFAAIIIIVLLVHFSFLWEGETIHQFVLGDLTKSFYMHGNLLNGYLISYITLNFLWVHIPVLVVIVTGDLFAGEAGGGTFRLMLTRPVTRMQIVFVKFFAGTVYTFLLMLLYALLSLGLGIFLFGTGDLVVILDSVSIIPENQLFTRFVLAFTYGFIGMTTIAFLSVLFSAMSGNSLGPILLTMAVIIVMSLITTFNFQVFNAIDPFLMSTYLDSWMGLFTLRVNWHKIYLHAGILILHCIVFYGLTAIYFAKKDILT